MSDKVKIENVDSPRGGFFQQNLDLPRRHIKTADGEMYLSSKSNAFIRLGGDRYGGPQEGNGALPKDQCGAIDLVVGTGPNESPKEVDLERYINLSFSNDAARVYISQRCHIDKWFGLTDGSEKNSSEDRSGIGIKADHVRVIGRQHIKIITGKSTAEGHGSQGEPNSLGGSSDGGGRIDLITGGNIEPTMVSMPSAPEVASLFGVTPAESVSVNRLQPAVKGENMVECTKSLIELIGNVREIAAENTKGIQEIAKKLMQHFHPDTPQPIPGSSLPDTNLLSGVIPTFVESVLEGTIANEITKYNTNVGNMKYLEKNSPLYICSEGVYLT